MTPSDFSPDGPPARRRDYAALSAGWGAALGTVLLAARDKGDEPVRAAEVVPLGLATFALSKLVAKEKVDKWVRDPFVEERPNGERRPKGRGLSHPAAPATGGASRSGGPPRPSHICSPPGRAGS